MLTSSAQPQDIITGDEIISDSYDLKEVDGTVYEVDCAMITLGAVEVSEYSCGQNPLFEGSSSHFLSQIPVPMHLLRRPRRVSRMAPPR